MKASCLAKSHQPGLGAHEEVRPEQWPKNARAAPWPLRDEVALAEKLARPCRPSSLYAQGLLAPKQRLSRRAVKLRD